ncbi:glycoside hydrolase family 2 TIM barrel-domain containing protein [Escherichia coli]|uniref:glycoside hydrolase family 2 TIM barrel-domain containing protein n=1 Tax=Escherichia coli TaxID=562 RepID=UPI00388F1FBE
MLIRGVNRHEHHGGQVMDEQTMVQDILLMKQNNFNAVRSHYPEPSAVVHVRCATVTACMWWMKPILKPTVWCH